MYGRLTVAIWCGLLCAGALAWTSAATAETRVDRQGFANALRALGWQVVVLTDGSLELSPRDGPTTAAQATRAEPTATGPSTSQTGDAPTGWAVLRDYGWQVTTDAEGATLLFPPGTLARGQAGYSASPADPAREQEQELGQLAPDLDALLAERGWRIERAADGSLLLFPLRREAGTEPDESTQAPAGPTAPPSSTVGVTPEPTAATWPRTRSEEPGMARGGFLPTDVHGRETALPLGARLEAKPLAASSLETAGDATCRVGEIRLGRQTYLAPVFGAFQPQGLRHQIAASPTSGRVLVPLVRIDPRRSPSLDLRTAVVWGDLQLLMLTDWQGGRVADRTDHSVSRLAL